MSFLELTVHLFGFVTLLFAVHVWMGSDDWDDGV